MNKNHNPAYTVYFEETGASKPRDHEASAAKVLARYFKSDIVFIRRASSRTPDLYILKTNVRWELKSPTGNSKHTIQNNLREANNQSENIVIDLSRSKMQNEKALSRAKEFFRNEHSRIKRIKIITREKNVIDVEKK